MEHDRGIHRKTADRSAHVPKRAGAIKVSPTQPHGWGVQPKSLESTPATTAELWDQYQQAKQRTQSRANNLHPAPAQAKTLPIQAKLTIGEPGDKYEQEADRVAAQVVEQIHAPAAAQSTPGESVQRQDELEEELQAKPSISVLQRLPLSPEVQREGIPEEEDIQAKAILQRGIAGGEASTDLTSAINSARGGGQAIAENIREPMEQAFGTDFSGVKVHTDGQSDQLNRSIQARAFTTGQDVFFRQGEYNPGSRGGQELLAHELTHVVQQNAAKSVVQREERETTIYTRQGEQWHKNMQIIDSTDISDYVHISRSTTTDHETFSIHQVPQNIQAPGNDANRRQRVNTPADENRDKYTPENNVHITLEGRYMQVMHTLATNMFDNREAIKNGPPVGNFANLNFGDFEAQGQSQVSKYTIQQWIEIAADDTEDFLRTNVAEDFAETVPDLIQVVHQVRDSTLNFTNQLIASNQALKQLEQNDRLVHYGGAPWART